ncbi:MAG: hypothetical protein HQ523_00070 [Lentisphaerae bacterium]|nr:hypothetical protein [Lentisphaerota bacterium]
MPLKLIHVLFVITSLVVTLGFAHWGLIGSGAQANLPVRDMAWTALLFSVALVAYGGLTFHKLMQLKGPQR